MIIFAIETSCDETSVCLLHNNGEILSHIVYSQTEHKDYGGVIPELASRAHLQILQRITRDAFIEAKIKIKNVDLFCATCGPGLIGGLLVGSTFAKALAIGNNKPFVPINHLEGHMLSPTFNNDIVYPYICFLLTGGHTQIYLIHNINKYELLGETVDDAIGEAFDKVAKLLGLPYPGGAILEKKALNGNIDSYDLPHPLKKHKNLNFSFSGIKTAVNLIVKKQKKLDDIFISNMAASFQNKISEILISKLELTINYLRERKINISNLSLVGGVAANKYLYENLKKKASTYQCNILMPKNFMLSDNAAMIAWACSKKYSDNLTSDIMFKADPRLKVNSI
jgi:N6-L-threonylcarbamoyladenine synthase